ncbi:hypothetical protein Despr_2465 [Desulfobulbus propionicus DSM 2032]|uniref:Uncharacterized protein n=1 Tax=Desulfobulbus propionicus (strain ATCC 33891 / DSM 2032 / VKM B-1956 / 1pr3) TaxID=577650 RepID=A0A7U3YNG0_DESPD|nr:hypothetical protein [Desulfobulbus propionicus]ADW18603.1 hypothetical protein Despr_2465 [Desulfobulbus propionicus DSM 2032]
MPPTQLTIFSNSGLHTVVRDVKEALNQAVKASGQSRDQVLDRMNELARRHNVPINGKAGVSKDLFEKWLNVEDDSRVPGIKALSLLCAALGTVQPMAVMVATLGGMVIEGEDVKLLEWARVYQKTKALRKKMKKIEEELG